MKKRIWVCMLMVAMLLSLAAGCGGGAGEPASTAPGEAASSVPEETAAPEMSVPEEPSEEKSIPEEPSVPEEISTEAPEGSSAEETVPEEPETCTVTFSDGKTFEATVGEDFVFFFQCDAPGDMGQPKEGEEGAGITVSDGTVVYSNVGLGGPYSYPTSELVTVSGFTGDFTVTICQEATNMGATYTIYVDEQEIADAIAFAEEMAAQMAQNPMPPME